VGLDNIYPRSNEMSFNRIMRGTETKPNGAPVRATESEACVIKSAADFAAVLHIDPSQAAGLRALCARGPSGLSDYLREAIDLVLAKYKEQKQ